MEKPGSLQPELTEEQLLTRAALACFFDHFQLESGGFGVQEVYGARRSDGHWIVGWRRPEAFPGSVEFVAAGATPAEAYDNAIAGQRLCASTMRWAMLDFECVLDNSHDGECHLASERDQ